MSKALTTNKTIATEIKKGDCIWHNGQWKMVKKSYPSPSSIFFHRYCFGNSKGSNGYCDRYNTELIEVLDKQVAKSLGVK